jgi:hypothetical protein
MSLDQGIYLPGKELQDFSKQRKTDRETAIKARLKFPFPFPFFWNFFLMIKKYD